VRHVFVVDVVFDVVFDALLWTLSSSIVVCDALDSGERGGEGIKGYIFGLYVYTFARTSISTLIVDPKSTM